MIVSHKFSRYATRQHRAFGDLGYTEVPPLTITPETLTAENPVSRAGGAAEKFLGSNAAIVTGGVVGYILRGWLGAALGAGLMWWQGRKKTTSETTAGSAPIPPGAA